MKTWHKTILFALAVSVLVPPSVWSDTVESLNAFVAGEKARSAEVNANFDALAAAVNGNDELLAALEARIEELEATDPVAGPQGPPGSDAEVLHVFDATGQSVGVYAGEFRREGSAGPTSVLVHLPEYPGVGVFELQTGEMREFGRWHFFFESVDCTGDAYSRFGGRVLRPNQGDNSVYVLTGTESVEIVARSVAADSLSPPVYSCSSTAESMRVFPAAAIDPVPDLTGPLYVAPATSLPVTE